MKFIFFCISESRSCLETPFTCAHIAQLAHRNSKICTHLESPMMRRSMAQLFTENERKNRKQKSRHTRFGFETFVPKTIKKNFSKEREKSGELVRWHKTAYNTLTHATYQCSASHRQYVYFINYTNIDFISFIKSISTTTQQLWTNQMKNKY